MSNISINPYTQLPEFNPYSGIEIKDIVIDRSKYFNKGWTYEINEFEFNAFPTLGHTSNEQLINLEVKADDESVSSLLGDNSYRYVQESSIRNEVNSVPEPTSLLLFSIGIVALARRIKNVSNHR